MLDYRPLEEIIHHRGLRLVLVRGMPSPWGQAAKAIMEVKKLDYVVAPQDAGGENEALLAWSGQTSGPVVAWADEPPRHHWLDILMLLERLAPTPSLIPADATQRAMMIGLSHEICGELGVGWNRRLQLFAPAMESGNPPAGVARMCAKYGYSKAALERASARTVGILHALTRQLEAQQSRGVNFFVGDALTALDLYWVTFMNLMDPLPPEVCPMPEAYRPGFKVSDPAILSALDPALVEHRDRIFKAYFRNPMEL
jgi:glutathione S-transferase